MNWFRLRKANQSDSDDNGVGRPQWDADYRLQAFPTMGMFEEYLEMGVSLCLHFTIHITLFTSHAVCIVSPSFLIGMLFGK